jgi:hypothetical protein
MSIDDERMIVTLTVGELRALIRDGIERHSKAARSAESKWADATTAAKHFGVTRQTIRSWVRLGAPATQIGTSTHPQYRIDLVEFDRWVRSQKARP